MSEAKKFDVKYIHYIITAIIIIGCHFMPQVGPITPMGMAVMGTFIGVIYGWTFLDMIWPSIFGLVSLGYIVGMQNVLTASLGSPVIGLCILTFAALTVLNESKLTDVIVRLVVSNRFAKGRPWVFVFFFFMCAYICAQINVFVSILLLSGILLDMCKRLEVKPFSPFPAYMLLGVALGVQMGQIMLPFRSSALTLVGAYSAMAGGMPNFGQYMAFVIPMGILMILVYVLIGRLVLRVDVSMIKNMPDDFFGEKAKLTSDQKKALGYLVGITLMLLSTTILPKTWAITTVLNKITMFGQAAIVILVLMTIKKEDGTPFFNYAACASKGMSWEGLWMTAFILPIAQYMTAAETGIAAGLRILLAPLSGLSPVMFVVGFMLFAAIITNFANNITLAVVMLPVGITFASQVGMPILGIACMIFVVTQLALFTPGASVPAGMAFSHSDWIKTSSMMTMGAVAVVIMTLVFMAVGIPYMNIIF